MYHTEGMFGYCGEPQSKSGEATHIKEGEEGVKWELGFALFLNSEIGIGFLGTGMSEGGNGK